MSTYGIEDQLRRLNAKFDERARKQDEQNEKLLKVLGRIAVALEEIAEPNLKTAQSAKPAPGVRKNG